MTSSGSVSTLRAVTPVRIRFRRQVYSGKNNINHRAKGEKGGKKPESMFHGAICLSLSLTLSLLRFFSSLSFRYFRKSCFFSLFSASVIIFHIGLDERFGKNRNVESSLSGEWKICCPYWNRINVRKQPVKVSIPPLLSSYKILTNVPNPDWIEPSTARSSTESVYRIQTSIPLEKFIFESDEPIKDSRISRHFFESETPFCWIPTAEWKKKEREKENYPRIPSENDKLGHQNRVQNHLDRFEIGPRRGWHALKDGKLPRREKTE